MMYIVAGRGKTFHHAVQNDDSKSYSSVCGYYYPYVLSGQRRIMLVDEVADNRRLCKLCAAQVAKERRK